MARVNRRLISNTHIDASKASSLGIPSLTAATTPVRLGGNTRNTATSNQKNTGASTAWEYYDTVGELSYVCRWLGNNLSQVKLMASDLDENGDPLGSTEDSTAAKIVADIAGGPAGQAQLLSRLATFLTVPGEGWVAVITRKDDEGNLGQEWHVLSSEEISHKGNQIVMELGDGDDYTLNPSTDILTRVYHPHPRRSREATSPTRVAIPILKEIQRTTATIDGAAKSRLAGNGILAIPSEVSMPVQAAPSSSKDAPGLPTPTPADSPTYDRKVSASDVSAQLQQVMTMAIQDPASAAALVPIVLQAPGEQIDNIRHITFESDITDTALNTRDKALLRLARTLDVPQEVLLGTADANHWCKDETTEILTRKHGWVTHESLNVGDEVLTLNHETGLSEWAPVDDIYRAEVVNEPMLSMESRSHSSLSTMGHNWPIIKTGKKVAGSRRRWTTSGDGFAYGDNVPLAAPLDAYPAQETYSDEFVALVAAYMSDGTLLAYKSGTHFYSRIAKFDDAEINKVRSLLTAEFGENGFREHAHPTRTRDGIAFNLREAETSKFTEVCGGREKVLTQQFIDSLTRAQLQLFLDSMIEIGDGVKTSAGWTFYQSSEKRRDVLGDIAIRLGLKVSFGTRTKTSGFSDNPLYWVSVSQMADSFNPRSTTMETVSYTGTVWCPTTRNRTWFARRNGRTFYTGNSAWQIDEAGIKSHISPMMTVICDALTDAILRPLLKTQGHADPSKVVVWFDTTKLTQRPNRSQDAKDAFAAGVLSDDKFREALGFTEDDAPPTDLSEEQLRSMAIQMVTKAPSLYPQLAEFIGFPAPTPQQVQQSQQVSSPGQTPVADLPVEETHNPPGTE